MKVYDHQSICCKVGAPASPTPVAAAARRAVPSSLKVEGTYLFVYEWTHSQHEMSTAGGGDEPPIDRPFGDLRPNLVEWVESVFEDCMAYDRTIFCSCRLCETQFGKGRPVVTRPVVPRPDTSMEEFYDEPPEKYSYLGFLNARRKAAWQREIDRMDGNAEEEKPAADEDEDLGLEAYLEDDDPQDDADMSESETYDPNDLDKIVNAIHR
ncbi:uncharacterized protein LOC110375776 [Helicoverpa armigera]|uniref:uncharacterized protein LOC110375776 n=1 Tax=Helicoverpa armigera TaxID=29058 RepID=UPI003083BC2C